MVSIKIITALILTASEKKSQTSRKGEIIRGPVRLVIDYWWLCIYGHFII